MAACSRCGWSPWREIHNEQKAIRSFVRDAGKGNLVIDAVAGSGKTFTLLEILHHTDGTVMFAAYNKAISLEIAERVRQLDYDDQVEVATFHSIGFKALRRAMPGIKMDENKAKTIEDRLRIPYEHKMFTRKLVSFAKNSVIDPEDYSTMTDIVLHFGLDAEYNYDPVSQRELLDKQIAQGIILSQAIMREHIEMIQSAGLIDFDDMMFAPLYFKLAFQKYDWVLVDESQDMNRARLMMARRMMRKDSRLVGVGDENQAIYGFSGAESDSINIMRKKFDAEILPLTVSFRCAKNITALARTWVPHIQSFDQLPDGVVKQVAHDEIFNEPEKNLNSDDVIICRNVKPLIKLAFILMAAGVKCHVEGRDIGKGMTKLISRFKNITRVPELMEKMKTYAQDKVKDLVKREKEMQAQNLIDQVEAVEMIAETLRPDAYISELKDKIDRLFADGGSDLHLCTVHKSKGREWNRVFLYGRETYMPSKFAKQPWQLRQENNLMYVAVTRARHELIEVIAKETQRRWKIKK